MIFPTLKVKEGNLLFPNLKQNKQTQLTSSLPKPTKALQVTEQQNLGTILRFLYLRTQKCFFLIF